MVVDGKNFRAEVSCFRLTLPRVIATMVESMRAVFAFEIEVAPEDALVVVAPSGVPKDSHIPRLLVFGVLPQVWGLVLLRNQAVEQHGSLLLDALVPISVALTLPHVLHHILRWRPDLELRDALEQLGI